MLRKFILFLLMKKKTNKCVQNSKVKFCKGCQRKDLGMEFSCRVIFTCLHSARRFFGAIVRPSVHLHVGSSIYIHFSKKLTFPTS